MSAPIRFIHCADLHLGSRFVGISTEDKELGKRMRSATFNALDEIVNKAMHEAVDFIVFSGDIYINTHGLTREQAAYNQYAPVLMTSVDTDPALCALERKAILQRLGAGEWQIFGAHGMKKEYSLTTNV